ncbi:MAG: efflux RND transporter periplasmic adaptor subunit, partial [Verrucomicrobiota bacterium]
LSVGVQGQVLSTHDRFFVGEVFPAGSELLRIDPVEYETAVSVAQAEVASRETLLLQEKAAASVARADWKRLGRGTATPLVLREPQIEEATRNLEAAKARLNQAEVNLRRTSVKVPFQALITAKEAEIGQYVMPGTAVATLQAIDVAEVRLPIRREDLRFLQLPRGMEEEGITSPVTVRARGDTYEGRIVRTENVIDEATGSLYVVVEVPDPYRRASDSSQSPLRIGEFVEATFQGRPVSGVVSVPRTALRRSEEVVLADEEGMLSLRQVEQVFGTAEAVWVRGLRTGDRLVLTAPLRALEGERVQMLRGLPEEGKL